MKFITSFALAAMLAFSSPTFAADPAAAAVAEATAHLKAVQEMLAAMQSEKLMRSITGGSGFPQESQRTSTFAKLAKMKPAEIHQRLARPVRRHVSMQTAVEMTRYYSSSYGKRVLQHTYNGGPDIVGMGAPRGPVPSESEMMELKRPALVKARKEFAKAEPAIRHEAFVLMQAINRS